MPPRPGEDVEHVLTEEGCREIDRAEEEWEELREKRLRSDWAPFHPFASEQRELLRPISNLHRQVAARYLRARKDFNLDTRAGKDAAYNYAVMLLGEIWPKEGVPLAELAAARERATAEPMRRREIALQLWLEEPSRIKDRPRDD
jgi:hypothetical protein